MGLIAILSSLPFESSLVLSELNRVRKNSLASKIIYKGRLSGCDILIMNTGIGKVNSAHSATLVAENLRVRFIVNLGIGGMYPDSGLNIGDIAIASKEIYGDEGVIGQKGWEDLKRIGIPVLEGDGKGYFNEFPMDKGLLNRAIKSFNLDAPVQMKTGNFVTLSSVSGTNERALELQGRFNALCENMEGAAIAHVCAIYKIPMLEIRGISNIAGIRDKRRWDIKKASENCQRFVLEVIKFL